MSSSTQRLETQVSFCHTFKCIQDGKLHFCNTFIFVIYKRELQKKFSRLLTDVAVYSSETKVHTDSDFTYRTPAEYYNMDDILRHKISHRPSKLVQYIEQSHDMYDFIPVDFVTKASSLKAAPPKAPKPVKDKISQPVKPLTPPPPSLPERPTVFPGPEETVASDLKTKPTYDRLSRVPDVEALKIRELGEWLRELKLEKYVSMFAEQGIDGVLLKELSRQDFKNDFGMSAIEAIKLSKFAQTGHVPQ